MKARKSLKDVKSASGDDSTSSEGSENEEGLRQASRVIELAECSTSSWSHIVVCTEMHIRFFLKGTASSGLLAASASSRVQARSR